MEDRIYRIGPDACWLGHQYEHNKTRILFEGYTPVDEANAIYLKFNGRKPYLIPMLDLALEVTQPLTEHPGVYECQIEERSADDTLISQSCKFNMFITKSLKAGAKYEVKDDRLETIYRHYNELYQRLVVLDEKFTQVDSVLLLGSANPVENDTITKEFGKDRTRLTAVEDRATVLEVRANTAETDIDNAEEDIEQLQSDYTVMRGDVDYCKKQIETFDPEGIVIVDEELSNTSRHPVENRVVTGKFAEVDSALASKANASETTSALAGKVDKVSGKGLSTNDYTNADKTALANKVDKESGKGLSTNDYTTTEKNKLAGIAAGAEVNVQSDWNATSGDAFIKNKPTLFSGSYNDLVDKPTLFSGNYNDLSNKPTLFSGSYNDLTDKPIIGDFTSSSGSSISLPAGINTGLTFGCSLELSAGTYLLIGNWHFNTRSGTYNRRVGLFDSAQWAVSKPENRVELAIHKETQNGGNVADLQVVHMLALSEADTITLAAASSVAGNGDYCSLYAMRIGG